jgi:hypothetical protein
VSFPQGFGLPGDPTTVMGTFALRLKADGSCDIVQDGVWPVPLLIFNLEIAKARMVNQLIAQTGTRPSPRVCMADGTMPPPDQPPET